MDRFDALEIFVAILDAGSLAGASRKLGRSPASVSRAVAFLEERVGAELLHRTTRSIKLSEVGEHYAATCRRVLTDLEEAEMVAAGEQSAPRGLLTLAAPFLFGETVLHSILDRFLDAHPAVTARLHLHDRVPNMIDDGIDVALGVGHLPNSTLVALRIGEVRQMVVAAPHYLAQHELIKEPGDLVKHRIIAFTDFGINSWSFAAAPGCCIPRTVQFTPRLITNSARGAVASAVAERGITRLLSYQVAHHVHAGDLAVILEDNEPPPLPVHLITPQGRLSVPKVRAFVDFVLPRLRAHFVSLTRGELPDCPPAKCGVVEIQRNPASPAALRPTACFSITASNGPTAECHPYSIKEARYGT